MKCVGYVYSDYSKIKPGPKVFRCADCKKERKNIQRRVTEKQKIEHLKIMNSKVVVKCKNLNNKNQRLKLKVSLYIFLIFYMLFISYSLSGITSYFNRNVVFRIKMS